MITIPWKKPTNADNYFIADIGNLRIQLKEHTKHWQLSMAIRTYSKDGSRSILRPYSNIIQFDKPCDSEQAKTFTTNYMDKFISGIFRDLSFKKLQ